MITESIDGIGSIAAGTYERIEVNGMGKLRGRTQTGELVINGITKIKGPLQAQKIVINGLTRALATIDAKEVLINGMTKVRRASLRTRTLEVNGTLTCTQDVEGDVIHINALSSIARLHGDEVEVLMDERAGVRAGFNNSLFLLNLFSLLYLGRKLYKNSVLIDELECMRLRASRLKSKVVRVNEAVLKNGCEIDRLYCTGNVDIDDSCRIGELIKE